MRTNIAFFIGLLFVGNFCYGRMPEMIPRTTLKCGETSVYKQTELISDSQQIGGNCVYTIRARSKFVCQMRIDFDTTLAPPTAPGPTNQLLFPQCDVDVLNINGMRLCGVNVDQHIYIPLNRSLGQDSTVISILVGNRAGVIGTPNWKLQVTQLECTFGSPFRSAKDAKPELRTFFVNDGIWLAPIGCTQYFPGSRGTVQSFNYNYGTGIYPGDLKYAICFRRTIQATRLELTFTTFRIGFEAPNTQNTDTECFSTIQTIGRNEDFLQIPLGQIPATSMRGNQFCGSILDQQTVITSAPGPLVVYFNSDRLYKANEEIGFEFNYNVIA